MNEIQKNFFIAKKIKISRNFDKILEKTSLI